MGEGTKKGAIKGKGAVCAGETETDKFNLDRKRGTAAEKEESTPVEQVPPDERLRVGMVVAELESLGFPFIKGSDFGLKRKILLEKFMEFHYSIGKGC